MRCAVCGRPRLAPIAELCHAGAMITLRRRALGPPHRPAAATPVRVGTTAPGSATTTALQPDGTPPAPPDAAVRPEAPAAQTLLFALPRLPSSTSE